MPSELEKDLQRWHFPRRHFAIKQKSCEQPIVSAFIDRERKQHAIAVLGRLDEFGRISFHRELVFSSLLAKVVSCTGAARQRTFGRRPTNSQLSLSAPFRDRAAR